MQYTSILTITAAFRLAIAAAIPRYSSTSTTMDETIAMIAPTIFETKTVTATVTAFKKLTIAVHKDNDVPAPSRREQSLTIALPTATPATPETPTQPRQTDTGSPPGPHYSPRELGIHPPLAQITPPPSLLARARDWRADRDKAISKAREAGARGRKQGQEGRKKGASAGASAAAAAARRMFEDQDRPVDWQDQIASAMSIASSALAYASSASLAAAATVTVTVPSSSDDDFYFTDDEGNVYHHRSHHDSSTTTAFGTPTNTSSCGPTQTEDPEEVLASGVDGRQTSHLASSVVSLFALLAAAGIQIL